MNGCYYNDEIEVGEWIRTHDGEIDRVIDIRDTLGERKLVGFERHNSLKSDIGLKHITKKHSPNIIDLIEANDYVNGYLVVAKSDDGYIEIAIGDDTEQGELLEQDDIESIVTHEQFKSIEYTIHEREKKENG